MAITAQNVMSRLRVDEILLEFMKSMVRNDIIASHASDVEQFKPTLDGALMRHFNRMKPHMSEMTWLNAHRPHCGLIMGIADLDTVLLSKGAWRDVQPQLSRLASGTRTGETAFAFAIQMVSASTFRIDIQAYVLDVVKDKFSEDAIKNYHDKCSAKLKMLEISKGIARRQATFTIKEQEYVLMTDPRTEVDLRLSAAIR